MFFFNLVENFFQLMRTYENLNWNIFVEKHLPETVGLKGLSAIVMKPQLNKKLSKKTCSFKKTLFTFNKAVWWFEPCWIQAIHIRQYTYIYTQCIYMCIERLFRNYPVPFRTISVRSCFNFSSHYVLFLSLSSSLSIFISISLLLFCLSSAPPPRDVVSSHTLCFLVVSRDSSKCCCLNTHVFMYVQVVLIFWCSSVYLTSHFPFHKHRNDRFPGLIRLIT